MGNNNALEAIVEERNKKAKASYIEWLKNEENPNQVGYDSDTKKWIPHKSPEGGTKTVGYGYKLTKAEEESQTVTINGKSVSYKNGLTNDQIDTMLKQEIDTAFKDTKNVFVKKYSEDDWNNLSEDSKYLLTDYSYNVIGGIGKYPSMMEGVKKGDWQKVKKEYKRGFYEPTEGGTHKKDKNGKWIEVESGGTHTYKELGRNKRTYNKFIAPHLDVGSIEDMLMNNMLNRDRGFFA